MIRPPMKEMLMWETRRFSEEKVNEEQFQGIIVLGFAAAQEHDEFTGKEEIVGIQVEYEEDVKNQDDDKIQGENERKDVYIDEAEDDSASEQVLF
jgi:hypothetical protein